MSENTQELLQHHWAMDGQAAEVMAGQIQRAGLIPSLKTTLDKAMDPVAVEKRDAHRERIRQIFCGEVDDILLTEGPCSLDTDVDYEPLFDHIQEQQELHPSALFAVRLNGAKPRTNKGWKGMWYSVDREVRQRLFEIYDEAFMRGIPILTEITENTQLGALTPWLSGAWVGARDVESTGLRGSLSAIHIPVGVKNPRDGDQEVVENALITLRSNTGMNRDSGADLGTIASSATSAGIATGILPVGEGNSSTAIFARGHAIPEGLSANESRELAMKHLSQMCMIGAKYNSAVVIDGTHNVPPMLSISKKAPDRFLHVLGEIHSAIEDGEIQNADQIKGVLGEVGPVLGNTDPNLVLDEANTAMLNKLIGVTVDLLPHKRSLSPAAAERHFVRHAQKVARNVNAKA